ncbi:MAG TPA: Gfo/Idh/MocA family oxidoreductase [Planctomycetaceae bacterium]|nr:Gfo/Idh/MocA family oxidoreductase [Planctomycetaceae bacterium]
MLNVGLIGLGTEWEPCYQPALKKLRHRVRVRSVFSPVITRAEQAAAELGCDVSPGILALMERDDVRAVLVLDGAWFGEAPARFACQAGKPAFLAGQFGTRLPLADQVLRRAAESGVTLMPDFRHRYTPATSRLRELIATRLGRPLSIAIDAGPAGPRPEDADFANEARHVLALAIDWSSNLVGTPPAAVRAAPQAGEDSGRSARAPQVQVEFRRPSAGGAAAQASIRFDCAQNASAVSEASHSPPLILRAEVRCAKGAGLIEGSQQLTWDCDGERKAESLVAERTEVEVMLDHFTRRVVGGLIPVPTLDDLCRAFQLAHAALACGEP